VCDIGHVRSCVVLGQPILLSVLATYRDRRLSISYMRKGVLRFAGLRSPAERRIAWWPYFGSFGDDFFSDDDD
jgi:hypothetical protein